MPVIAPNHLQQLKRATRARLARVHPRFDDDPRWAVGMLAGRSLSTLEPLEGIQRPIVQGRDVPGLDANFVADPFALYLGGTWYLFYEAMDRRTGRGVIAYSTSDDLHDWSHHGTVLAEPFHLSYPWVVAIDDGIFMIPEAWQSGAVRLYRADPFPYRWEFVGELITGPTLLDPTPFVANDGWAMFVETSPTLCAGELRLFRADALAGPWTEHPSSPVVVDDPGHARPAGRVVTMEGRRLRFAQDCARTYGEAVRAAEITHLDDTGYAEEAFALPVLSGSGSGWNADAMHHIDLHRHGEGWVAFVDGYRS